MKNSRRILTKSKNTTKKSGKKLLRVTMNRTIKRWRRYWKKRTPEEREKYSMVCRARRLNCPVIIPFTKREIIRRDGLNCYLCRKLLTYDTATIDHVIPLS